MGYRNMLELEVAKAGGDHATVANGGLRLRGLDRRTGDGRHAVVAICPEDFTVGGGENEIWVRLAVVEYRGRSWPARLSPGDEITLASRLTAYSCSTQRATYDREAAGAVAARGPTLGRRLAERGVDRTLRHLAPVLLVLGLLFVYPSSTGSSCHSGPRRGAALANYRTFFEDADTIFTAPKIALPATLINVPGRCRLRTACAARSAGSDC